jgi:hypothetical protein
MHNDLRYQAKTHTISEKLYKKKKKKISSSPPIFYLFFVENNKIEKKNKDMLMEKEITSSPNM